MIEFSVAQIAGFLLAAALITLAPGPDNLSVLSLGLSRGRHAGIGFGLGCALGCFTHTVWATLGVTALIAASETAFLALKMAGAAYLVWLGIQALRSAGANFSAEASGGIDPAPWRAYLLRGFIANAINPKVALFFLAFLPQFTNPAQGRPALQMLQLGMVFAVQTILVFGTLAFAAGGVGRLLARRPGAGIWLDRGTGLLFIGLALRLVLDGVAFSPRT